MWENTINAGAGRLGCVVESHSTLRDDSRANCTVRSVETEM